MPDHDTLVTPADEFNPLLTAADVMTAAPRTCSPFSAVVKAVLIFRDADCGFVPVVDGGTAVGVLTDRDVALALADYRDALAATPVGDVMTRDVVSVPTEARLDAVLKAFTGRAVRRVLVVDGAGQLAGVISWEDLTTHVTGRGLGGVVQRVVVHP